MSKSAPPEQEISESGLPTGIEADGGEESSTELYDPSAIYIDQRSVSMQELIRRIKQKSINLTPSFQRKEVWDDKRKSRLIESLMLNIPLPMFYVAADENGAWEVVDGLQRLSAIKHFLVGNDRGELLKLQGLEFLGAKFDGEDFQGIADDSRYRTIVHAIMSAELRFTVVNPGTAEAVKRNIFQRINTGGMHLTPQEIRHSLYQGSATDLLNELAASPGFRAVVGEVNDSRMGASELILRFFTFLIFPRNAYAGAMDTWLSNTMRVINCMPDVSGKVLDKIFEGRPVAVNVVDGTVLRHHFEVALQRASELFGAHAFRKSLDGQRRAPINKALFESWGNALASMSESNFARVLKRKQVFLERYGELLSEETFLAAIGKNSSRPHDVLLRYTKIVNLLDEAIGEHD